jgi:hypothetical protein
MSEDDAKQIVEVVGDDAGQPADGIEALHEGNSFSAFGRS